MSQQTHQERGRAGAKPVTAHYVIGKAVDDAERIVDVGHLAAEVIAVVHILQPCLCLLLGDALAVGQFADRVVKNAVQLLLSDAAK